MSFRKIELNNDPEEDMDDITEEYFEDNDIKNNVIKDNIKDTDSNKDNEDNTDIKINENLLKIIEDIVLKILTKQNVKYYDNSIKKKLNYLKLKNLKPKKVKVKQKSWHFLK